MRYLVRQAGTMQVSTPLITQEARLNYVCIFTKRDMKQVNVGCALRTVLGAQGAPYIDLLNVPFGEDANIIWALFLS